MAGAVAGAGRRTTQFVDDADAVARRPAPAPSGRGRCSAASTRAASVSGVSPGSTGTAAWAMIGPLSIAARTKCTVQPCSLTPASRARAWVLRPVKAGSSEGWMLISRSRQRSTKPADSSRMKPARQTSSMPAASSARRRAPPRIGLRGEGRMVDDVGRRCRPRRARSRPAASGRLDSDQRDLGRVGRVHRRRRSAPPCCCRGRRSGWRFAAVAISRVRGRACRRRRPARRSRASTAPRRKTVSPHRSSVVGERIGAAPASAITTMPTPQLKVRSISASASGPVSASQRKTGGTSIRAEVDPGGEVARAGRAGCCRSNPPPVMWASALMPPGLADRGEQRLDVDAGRREQRPPEGRRRRRGRGSRRASRSGRRSCRTSEKPLEWTPDEARPRMTSPAAMSRRGRIAVALDGADGEAGEIEVLRRIHARHFGGFAADQGGAGDAAAAGDAGDDVDRHGRSRSCRWRNSRGRTAARRPGRRGR